MNKNLKLFIAMLALIPAIAISQDFEQTKAKISHAVYRDKTPPLRDMKIILPGERDRSWKDGLVQNDPRGEEKMFDSFVQPEIDAVHQKEMGSRNTDGPIYSFPGVGDLNNLAPPDTDGDVGPNHYFQMVNVSFAIWDKQGTMLYGPADNSTIWDGFVGPWTGTNDGDPVVIYDELEDRWIVTQFAVFTANNTNWQLIAVSETGDPTGAYYRYAYQYTFFNDYPKFSSWPDAYYATFNMINNAGYYAGATICAFEKDSMIVGGNARMVEFGPYQNQYGANSADLDGPTLPPAGSPNWVVNLDKYGTPQQLEIYKFEVNWANPSASTYMSWDNLTVSAFSFFNPNNRNQLPQPNSTQKLDPLSKYSMFPLKYRNFGTHESMTINHTVKLGLRAGIRWYELRKDAGLDHWYIYQEGTYAPNDTESRWMASMAMNAAGDIALGYSVTSETVYPSIRYTGRSASTPLGEMDVEEVTIVEGTYSQSGAARWGDYSYMTVDPSDDMTFWYTQEYMPSSSWGTYIASFDLGPVQPPTAYAGDDSQICNEQVYYGHGTATAAQSLEWTSLGDGVLMYANTLNPAYLRGNQDIANGYFELIFKVIGYEPGWEAIDTVHVDIIESVIVNAGADSMVCIGQSFITQPEVIFGDSLLWSTSGDGSFNDPTQENAIYTPGSNDINNGSVVLSLFAKSIEPCEGEDTDDMNLTIEDCTGIEEGKNQKISLNIFPNPSAGLFNINVNSSKSEDFILRVLNMQGQQMFQGAFMLTDGSYINQLDLSHYPKGIYYLMIQTDKSSVTKKVLLN